MKNVEDQFLPYEQALELKELGFNECCFGLYAPPCKAIFLQNYKLLSNKEQILAPLYQQVLDWFLERKIYIEIFPRDNWNEWWYVIVREDLMSPFYEIYPERSRDEPFTSKHEAQLEAIKQVIKILKNEKNI